MINIFRSLGYASVAMGSLGWLSFLLIGNLLKGPNADSSLAQYVADNIIFEERLEDLGWTFSDVSEGLFLLIAHMNIALLAAAILMALSWSALSHFLNIDAPGKAKIYFIHWTVFTGALGAILFSITWYFTQSSAFAYAETISSGGVWKLTLFGIVFYTLIYYLGVVFGTARFARSSVLFANKLPGGF